VKRLAYVVVTMLLAVGVAGAQGFDKGDKEAAIRLSYADVDLGSARVSATQMDVDFGEATDRQAALFLGYFFTRAHEVGVSLGYTRREIDDSEVLSDEDVDGPGLGLHYAYHFATGSWVAPYLGVHATVITGDLGDLYDYDYGAEAGVKLYPSTHAGAIVAVGYTEWSPKEGDETPDASALTLTAGFGWRF
jgi:hypothetical protein